MKTTNNNAVFHLKQNTISSLNKLSDRDTFRLASDQLHAAAQSLSPDTISPFLTCLLDDSNHKPAVRSECLRLTSAVLRRHHRLAAPLLPKILSALSKRLKDPDSLVRDSLADTVSVLASELAHTEPLFLAVARPLFEALGEQNKHVQCSSATCLAKLVQSSPSPPLSVLARMLARTTKLLNNPHFLAKPALIQLNTAVVVRLSPKFPVAAVGAVQDALGSSDWPTRKAAAAALAEIGLSVGGSSCMGSLRVSCVKSLELCRFDKVKPVRDTVLNALQCWNFRTPEPSEPASSAKESFCDYASASESRRKDGGFNKKVVGASSAKPRLPLSVRKKCLDPPKSKDDDWRIEIALPKTHSVCLENEEELDNEESESSSVTKNFERLSTDVTSMRDIGYEYVHMDDKQDCSSVSNFVTDKFESRLATKNTRRGGLEKGNVAKLLGMERDQRFSSPETCTVEQNYTAKNRDRTSLDSTVTESGSPSSHGCCSQTANEIVCIRKQLLQIEDKQSNLMELFQVFTAGLMENLSVLQSRLVRLEDVVDRLAQNVVSKQTQLMNSPRRSTCTPRPSVDLHQQHNSLKSSWMKPDTQNPNNGIGRPSQLRNSSKHSIWKRVRGFMCEGDIDSAYTEALCSGDDLILVELLDTTGPVLECLSPRNIADVLTTLASYLLQNKFTSSVFPWMQQVVELSNIHGPNHLVLTTKIRQKLLSALEEVVGMDFSNPLEKRCFSQIAIKLHQIWGNGP